MTIVGPNKSYLFVHNPKCAGSYISKQLLKCGGKKLDKNNPHMRFKNAPKYCPSAEIPGDVKDYKFIFTFIRDPNTWYYSLWKHGHTRTMSGWPYTDAVQARYEDFRVFMNKMRNRNAYEKVMLEYTYGCDFAGDYGNFDVEFRAVLDKIGCVCTLDNERANVSKDMGKQEYFPATDKELKLYEDLRGWRK